MLPSLFIEFNELEGKDNQTMLYGNRNLEIRCNI